MLVPIQFSECLSPAWCLHGIPILQRRHIERWNASMNKRLTAVIQREGNGFVAFCPELDIASQGDSIQSARESLREALELFFECASPGEIEERLSDDVFVTHVEVTIG